MKYETGKIKSNSYELEVVDNELYVADYWYPMVGYGNFQAQHLVIWTTPKRAWIKDWTTRDNWNGSGVEQGEKVPYENKKEVEKLIKEAKKLLGQKHKDNDDYDFEIMKFVTEVFEEYTNMPNEEMEALL